ncbi:alpha/beta hydrolase [Albimonas pacifica]|uniref:TAP-like protein n=1 Tax=Albimonas pacifica TaxID=1114924 RepID=A0A1I3CY87_9RHOB|nr:alpha/beta fold hydrolase [Albimonas pacifica]SFH79403.1 TAP-like protein [Albimonas pacifica]
MTPDQIFAFVVALMSAQPAEEAFPGLASGGHDPRYPVTLAPCLRPLDPWEIEGRTIVCGRVDVPADHAAPEGRRIALGFAILRARSLSPAPDPLVFLQGGPGADVVSQMQTWAVAFADWRQRRDVIVFDQRGNGVSDALTACRGATSGHFAEIAGAPPATGAQPVSPDALLVECRAEIADRGEEIALINTAQNAGDVAALVSALGFAQGWNLYGGSYGTKLGLEVMRQDPPGLRAAILDGVAPPMVRLYDELAGPPDEAAAAIFDQCAGDPACAAAYPDLEARFNALMEKLAAAPIPGARGRPPATPELVATLIKARNKPGVLTGVTAWLPKMIVELEAGETATLDAIIDDEIPPPAPTAAEVVAAAPIGLTEDQKALAEAILHMAEQQKASTAAMRAALVRLGEDASLLATPEDLPEAFERAMLRAAQRMTRDETLALLDGYAALRVGPQRRGALLDFVAAHFAGDLRLRLSRLVQAMTPADVTQTFARLERDARPYEAELLFGFHLMVYACQEDLPWNGPETAKAFQQTLRIPVMGAGADAQLESLYGQCAALFEPAPRPGFHAPVRSSVPTLLLNGLMDVQTSWKWGALAAETLDHATNLAFPETGHGTLLYHACSRDIGVAFIENPQAPVEAGCIDDLAVKWVLPDGTRSAGSPWPVRHR